MWYLLHSSPFLSSTPSYEDVHFPSVLLETELLASFRVTWTLNFTSYVNLNLPKLEISRHLTWFARNVKEWLQIQGVSGVICNNSGERLLQFKLHRCNQRSLYPKFNGYGENGERSFKEWDLLSFIYLFIYLVIYFSWLHSPSGPRSSPCRGFDITLRHTTLGKTPLYEWSARCRDFYLKTHNIHKRHTSMPQAGFEPTIPASERPQTHV
jgi:hypothetical protein